MLKQEARADQMRKSADGARKQAQKEKEESDRAWRLPPQVEGEASG